MLPAALRIQTFKTDYLKPLEGNGKLKAGMKFSLVKTDNTASVFDIFNNVKVHQMKKNQG
jgi:hypothetical protein